MKRDIEEFLLIWKDEALRYPLLVRGARQVGKSYTIKKFGREEFANLVEVNFEQKPQFASCFDSLEPEQILQSLSILSKSEIVPGKTLLFLDEIQECPQAITSLRYFHEQMPALHVIGAGSLLEFVMSQQDFKMPVGRVQYLYMKPLSFLEFLDAAQEHPTRELVESITWDRLPSAPVHQHLMAQVRKYAFVGGMPAVVSEYVSTGKLEKCLQIQSVILQTYRDDFGKYASKVKTRYLQKMFFAVPKMVGRKLKYSHVDSTLQSRDLKEALELLEKAGVVHRIRQTSGEGLPLEANAKERHFKAMFLDIGLMQNLCGLSSDMLVSADDEFIQINAGAVAEQFVAQELLAYRDHTVTPSLFYWAREARNSNAEIDYLVPCGARALPVEVKAGKTGTLRSMHLFLDTYRTAIGMRISQQYFNRTEPILSIPFYAIARIDPLVKDQDVETVDPSVT
ncbi:ATP-binding protein [Planctomycetota bacterium]